MSIAAARGLKVLVVEDDPDSQVILTRQLVDAGVLRQNIQVVDRGDRGMDALKAAPDLVISDLCLPRVSGAEVVRAAKRLGICAHLVSTHPPLSFGDVRLCTPKCDMPSLLPAWLGEAVGSTIRKRRSRNATITAAVLLLAVLL